MKDWQEADEGAVVLHDGLVQAELALLGPDGFTKFQGQDCGSQCRGWNGRSEKCECGRNRVRWRLYFDDPQSRRPCVFAEVY